jgi:4-amino-4-deoxy-L-arabinose transferase-like glycosyltransferase
MSRSYLAITLILLLAAALRFGALGEVPPGLCHDEVANWRIARDILAGRHAIYFTAAYGHEPFYQYAQAATVALFGDHWLGLRWPSVALGLLGIAATYILVRRLFGVPVALLTSAWLAVSFWPLFYARVALRAITLPFTAALCAYFLFRAIDPDTGLSPAPVSRRKKSALSGTGRFAGVADWLLTGLFLGLSVYTYMAARVLPFILAAFLVYVFLIRSSRPVPWSRILVFFLVAASVSAPLLVWLATHPDAEYRIAEVREPLDRLLAGDPSLVWHNLIANLRFFTFSGDPWPRQNLPGRPVFADPISAGLFYVGLLIALRRWRDPRYGFLLVWLAGALVPSVVTAVAPSSIRDILGLVVVFVFPALALVEAGHWIIQRIWSTKPQTQHVTRNTRHATRILPLASCLLLFVPLYLTARDYFFLWPQHDVVRFDYQADLTAVARRLDALPPDAAVTVAGLSVHTMDAPGLALAARRDVRDVRLCDTRETLVTPAGQDAWLFVPQVVPLDGDLRERLVGWGATVELGPQGVFTSYRLSDAAALPRDLQRLERMVTLPGGDPVTLPVSFGERLAFLGYEWLQRPFVSGDGLTLLTYWRVETPSPAPLKAFVHLSGEPETPIAQHDGLGSPPHGWEAGDLIIQKHTLPWPVDLPPGRYRLQAGLYDAATGVRLPVLTADRLLLYSFEVAE